MGKKLCTERIELMEFIRLIQKSSKECNVIITEMKNIKEDGKYPKIESFQFTFSKLIPEPPIKYKNK